jgi:hypothetical protein
MTVWAIARVWRACDELERVLEWMTYYFLAHCSNCVHFEHFHPKPTTAKQMTKMRLIHSAASSPIKTGIEEKWFHAEACLDFVH